MDFNLRLGGLTLSGSGALIDGKLTTDFCSFDANGNPDCTLGPVAAAKGTRLPVQPIFKGNTTARYEFEMSGTKAFVQASLNHQSGSRSYLTTREADLLGVTKGFETLDFSMGAKLGGFDISAYIENAFDKRGILSINTACTPSICGAAKRYYPIKPQVFGVKIGHDF
jgi:outer membrane receptor protein involved in Fe transport